MTPPGTSIQSLLAPDTADTRAIKKRLKNRLYQRNFRARREQELHALEDEVQALHAEITRLGMSLFNWKVAALNTQLRSVQQHLDPGDPSEDHAKAIVTQFFDVYKYGYTLSVAPLQERFLRSILTPDVGGVDIRTADAFVQQWRLCGQHFSLCILEPQGWTIQSCGDSIMVVVEVMLYLRFLRQTIGALFPALKNGDVTFETVQPLVTGTSAVVSTYTFVVDRTGKINTLLVSLRLLETLHRVLGSLGTVVRLTEGARIALDCGTIRLA